MNMRYVLTKDGYTAGWGSEIYLLGVFDDKETAERMAKKHNCKVTEIEANKFFPLVKKFGDYENDYYLGGYTE